MNSSLIFQVQSVLIIALLFFGISKRKQKTTHIRIMKFAIAWDLLLVAQIELTRGAIATASKMTTNPALLNIHVFLAVSTVILYLFVYLAGTKLAGGDESVRLKHKILAGLTMCFRLSTFVTSNLIEIQ